MGKTKVKLDAFKKKIKKTGIATIEVDGENLSFPIKLKNELAMRDIVNYTDIKLLSLINPVTNQLQATRAVRYVDLPKHLKTLVSEAEGFSMEQVQGTFMIIHDEKALESSANRRDFIMNNVAIICHIDFDYIVDEDTGKTYIDEINESLGTSLKSDDYINIVITLYDEGILTTEVAQRIAIQAEAIRRGEDSTRTEQRFIARQNNMNEELWLQSLDKIKKEEEAMLNGEELKDENPLFMEFPEKNEDPKPLKKPRKKSVNESKEEESNK